MKRNIVEIDREACNGCGLCVEACHEGALQMIDGKATLVSDSYCDGLGHCLPACPMDAIRIIERDADEYDDELVQAAQKKKQQSACSGGGCPGSRAKTIAHKEEVAPNPADFQPTAGVSQSELQSWPVQIKLVPPNAPYFEGAHLLIAADCTAFAYANFHKDFMKGKITLIGCPKLDSVDYADKLTDILCHNNIKSVTVLRMEVPCCAGMVHAVTDAVQRCGKMIPWRYTIITTDGEIKETF